MRLLFSQLVIKLLCPHMASLLHIQTQWWVTCSILTLLFLQRLVGTYWLLSLRLTHAHRLWVPVSIRGARSWKTCLKSFTSKVFCSPFLSWQWTVRSWWTLLQPLYVNTAVTRPSLGISKIVSAHSCQTAATQRLTVGHGPRSDEKTSEEGGRS